MKIDLDATIHLFGSLLSTLHGYSKKPTVIRKNIKMDESGVIDSSFHGVTLKATENNQVQDSITGDMTCCL